MVGRVAMSGLRGVGRVAMGGLRCFQVFRDAQAAEPLCWHSPEFDAEKADGRFPLGLLPVLELELEGGRQWTVCQSRTIERCDPWPMA